MKKREFNSVKQYLITFAVAVCCVMTSSVFTACSNEDTPAPKEQQTDLVLNFGDIVIKPYLGFGTSLADAERYFQAEFPDYASWESTDLISYEDYGQSINFKAYYNGNCIMSFYFDDADCKNLILSNYNFHSSIPLETLTAELERHGFKNMGEANFPDSEGDATYIFLSADGKLEVQIAVIYATEEHDQIWGICFQPFDERDMEYLVK